MQRSGTGGFFRSVCRLIIPRKSLPDRIEGMIKAKRVYDEPSDDDGYRVLVDRLWARGLSKEQANVDLWLKDVAPSDSLRKWFAHDPRKWSEFKKRYKEELKDSQAFEDLKRELKRHKRLTLLFAAKDPAHNNAAALVQMLNHGSASHK